MKPLINWDELRKISMPPRPPGEDDNRWDHAAAMYNQMAAMEKSYTLNQINAFDAAPTDTVLDIGCGPGRISVPMAKKAQSVTAIDTSEKMLGYCEENAAKADVHNLNARLLDWKSAVLGKDLEQHDIVIACRSVGMEDLAKLSSFARKYAVVIAWANAPCIPDILNDLFEGTEGESIPRKLPPRDRRLGYNVMYNIVYDLGYDPNIKIVTDGFTKDFANREEAYADLRQLGNVPEERMDRFRANVDKWLTENEHGGITFRRETKTFVMWWEPNSVRED